MTRLTVLREEHETERFARQRMDDARTAIPSSAAHELEADLRSAIDGEVRFDKGSRALYATDGSNYRQAPIGVVIPRHKGDVMATVTACRRHGAPVLSRGGGTSLSGQCCNVAVVIDHSKYLREVIEIDPQRRLGTVEVGCVLDTLRDAARKHGLTFAPDPATHDHCAIGGMLGNNSCGVHSLISKNNGLGLRASDNTHELEVLTFDGERFRVGATPPEELERIIAAGGRRGEIYRGMKQLADRYADDIRRGFPKLERRVSGYNLDDLLPENGFHVARALVGSEGTLATYLEATLHLVPYPPHRSLLLLGYADVYRAAEHLMRILEFRPDGLEGMDDLLAEFQMAKGTHAEATADLPEGKGWLFVEFGGESPEEAAGRARECMDALRPEGDPPSMRLVTDRQEMLRTWEVRESALGATAFVPHLPDTWPGWEDSAVPVEKLPAYLHDLRNLFDRFGYKASTYGHFGQGIVHCRIPFDLYTKPGIEKFQRFMEAATDLCVKHGGSFSGEHGDGQARAQYLEKMFGPRLVEAFREFKRIWDPDGKMNPGKVVDAWGVAENLRLGPDYSPPQPKTYFEYPDDENSFARATLRCVGVGKCRRESGGTMCPSYMVTKEEMHSTRGRERLLWEMLNGEVIDEGWRSEAVYEALDLCLACKGCKGDCPVNVDMATYKAEFRAHYFEKRLRPLHMFAFGWISIWANLASHAPTIANFFSQAPGLRSIARYMAGMTQKRQIPPFAPRTFKTWFAERPPRKSGRPVVLYADTFTNHFSPDIGKAAVEVLEDAGFRVIVPMENVCCGRPLYDYGFLNMARRWLQDNLQKLRPYIQQSIPFIVLEPSCWSVFSDELTNMLPRDKDAQRLKSNVWLLDEFLQKHAPHYELPQLRRKAMLHRHCHHKSLLKNSQAEAEILQQMGMECSEPESGCCGMAGAFGYEKGAAADVAVACGERVLLPRVREAQDDELLIADGFSCREMIAQSTGRHAIHLAQAIQLARRHGPEGPRRMPPEQEIVDHCRRDQRRAALRTGAIVAAGAVIAAGLWLAARRSALSSYGSGC